MKPAFTESFHGLECVAMELGDAMRIAHLLSITAGSSDQMDTRTLPGMAAVAEMLADRLDDLRERTDAFVREWQRAAIAAKSK